MAELKTKASDYDPKFGKLVGAFATNQDLEQNGVWRTHAESGVEVKIRRSTLPEYKRAVRKHYKPFAHLTSIDPRDEQLVKMKAAAEVLVADWKIGSDLPCNAQNALDAMKAIPDFYDWVQGEADTFTHYKVARIEEDAGNSADSSNGSGNGESLEPQPLSSVEQPEATLAAPQPQSPI